MIKIWNMYKEYQMDIPLHITHNNNFAQQAQRIVKIQDGEIIDDREVG